MPTANGVGASSASASCVRTGALSAREASTRDACHAAPWRSSRWLRCGSSCTFRCPNTCGRGHGAGDRVLPGHHRARRQHGHSSGDASRFGVWYCTQRTSGRASRSSGFCDAFSGPTGDRLFDTFGSPDEKLVPDSVTAVKVSLRLASLGLDCLRSIGPGAVAEGLSPFRAQESAEVPFRPNRAS